MSGDATLRPSKTIAQQESLYSDVLGPLGLEDLDANERVLKLKTLAPDEIIRPLPPLIHVGPNLDGIFLKETITLGNVATSVIPVWCESLVVGDCLHDVSLLSLHTMALAHRTYRQVVLRHAY